MIIVLLFLVFIFLGAIIGGGGSSGPTSPNAGEGGGIGTILFVLALFIITAFFAIFGGKNSNRWG